jgi:hypothetical protein
MRLGGGILSYYGDDVLAFDTLEEKWSRIGKMPYGLVTSHCGTNQTHIICIAGEPRHGHFGNTESVVQIAAVVYAVGTGTDETTVTGRPANATFKSDDEFREEKVSGGVTSAGACAIVDVSSGTTTLHDAQQKARTAAATAPCVTVMLGQRSFRLHKPLVLSAADSHTTWVGQGTDVTTAVDVPADSWKGNRSSAVLTLDASPLIKRSNYGTLQCQPGTALPNEHMQLLVQAPNGIWRPMTLARWPNVPFDVDGALPVNWTTVKSLGSNCTCPLTANGACVDAAACGAACKSFIWADDTDRPLRWVKAAAENRLFIHGLYKYLWHDFHTPITGVDPVKRLLSSNVSISPYGITNDSFWYAYGLIEELDNVGEYVLDEATATVSAIFPDWCLHDGNVLCKTRLVPAVTESSAGAGCFPGNCSSGAAMIRLVGATNVTIQGLNVSGSTGAGLSVIGSTNILIDNCVVSSVLNGVVVMGSCSSGPIVPCPESEGSEGTPGFCCPDGALTGSFNVALTHSEIAYTGMESSTWSGGNRTALRPAGLLVENNRFHDFGMWFY